MQLHFYKERFKKLINQYKLTEEQLRYTGTPNECVKLSNQDSDRYSILVMKDDELVTFFVLHKNDGVKPYTENEKSILIRAFSTDFHHQGKGYAKQALKILPEFIRNNFLGINEIILAVNAKNLAAQSLYKKCGFCDKGVRRAGRKGELIIMSYYL
ncbi:GNAT family N-acetyltransferase [Bacillus pseudomycoides]|uniref:GNAT family N-acetyltransferase n=1 Tax=Bacillus pseudomycoides TaxID=64104 RepID=UPI000BEE36BE|nr:GNAT family N-acetyltransferase [Bacillus pseudomycoides]PDY46422.1 GNAT family N-acetyltransferase [Bacillus pseudomycoides]PHB45767.1 GNAT family N-acetyltransferase [Bacillus pseudomycoides]